MKLITENKVSNNFDGKKVNFSISEDQKAAVFNSLINIYQDPVGSTVRELVSNAFDATISSTDEYTPVGVEKHLLDNPITVTLTDNEFKVEDRGCGMTLDFLIDTYSVLGESSSRGSTEHIGGYGLGKMTSLAYNSEFTIVTRKDGKQVIALCSYESLPTISIISHTDTDMPNGTTVSVPIKSSWDARAFYDAVKDQVLLFKNTVYLGTLKPLNDIQFMEFDNFYVVGSSHYDSGIVIGPIKYPADEFFSSNICLKFGLNDFQDKGITPHIPSREQLKTIPIVKDVVRAKLNEAHAELGTDVVRERLGLNIKMKSVDDELDFIFNRTRRTEHNVYMTVNGNGFTAASKTIYSYILNEVLDFAQYFVYVDRILSCTQFASRRIGTKWMHRSEGLPFYQGDKFSKRLDNIIKPDVFNIEVLQLVEATKYDAEESNRYRLIGEAFYTKFITLPTVKDALSELPKEEKITKSVSDVRYETYSWGGNKIKKGGVLSASRISSTSWCTKEEAELIIKEQEEAYGVIVKKDKWDNYDKSQNCVIPSVKRQKEFDPNNNIYQTGEYKELLVDEELVYKIKLTDLLSGKLPTRLFEPVKLPTPTGVNINYSLVIQSKLYIQYPWLESFLDDLELYIKGFGFNTGKMDYIPWSETSVRGILKAAYNTVNNSDLNRLKNKICSQQLLVNKVTSTL